MDAKATDLLRDRNLSANYSCGLLRLCLETDWSQNNKHSRNNFRRSWFNGFHCKCVCCSSICTLVQFVFVPVQNILNWYKIFCASPIFNFIVQFVVNLQY